MARYNASVHSPRPPGEVFAYLSDFSTTAEWDPGVVEAERLGDMPVGEGSEFRVVATFLHRKTPLTYRIIEYGPPNAVTFRGENSWDPPRDRNSERFLLLSTSPSGTPNTRLQIGSCRVRALLLKS